MISQFYNMWNANIESKCCKLLWTLPNALKPSKIHLDDLNWLVDEIVRDSYTLKLQWSIIWTCWSWKTQQALPPGCLEFRCLVAHAIDNMYREASCLQKMKIDLEHALIYDAIRCSLMRGWTGSGVTGTPLSCTFFVGGVSSTSFQKQFSWSIKMPTSNMILLDTIPFYSPDYS